MSLPSQVQMQMPSITFTSLLEQLYAERYTGAVVLHFGEGMANAVHFLKPVQQIRIDKPPREGAGS